MTRTVLFLLALLLPALAHASPPVQPAPRPTEAVKPAACVTSQCHPAIKDFKVLHSPVATNACDSCHELTDAKKHTFTVRRQKADLCTYCHEFSTAGLPAVHKPVAQGQCLGCHDPHGGPTRAMTIEKSMTDLCARCHESVTRDRPHVHGPVAQGACDSCHPPHAAKFPKLLDAVGSDLCLACHKELEPALASAKSRHKALEQGCQKCHDPHGSRMPMSLVQSVPDLCYSCHDKLKAKIAAATVPHSAITQDRSCLNCHAPHASNVGKMLSDLPSTTCLKCHDKPVKNKQGTTIAAVPEVADPKLLKHGQLRDGMCGGCHDVHGGQLPRLLVRQYSPAFYQKFNPDDYALCFGCHDLQLAQAAKSTQATSFRNGPQNLHFAHANTGTHDRNCRACHLAHASTGPRLVRTTLKFGKWDMPLDFRKTPTGGTCSAGCHEAYAYDRDRPVPATAPATRLARPAPRAQHDDPRLIAWATTDITGAAVKIPDPSGRPTLVLLAVADDPALPTLLATLRTAIKAPTQTLVVLTGPHAADQTAKLASAKSPANTPAISFIADANNQASSALGVRGWPVALVLKPDGLELARLTGESTTLAPKLPPYLDYAAGRLSSPALQSKLATKPVIEAPATQQAARDLRTARVLLEHAKPAEALAYLDRNRDLSSPDVLMLRVEALLQLDRPTDALKVLDALPVAKSAPPAVTALRARALIAENSWSQAKPLLESALARDPASPALHRLMGQVFEHEQNWPEAARHYRAAAP